MSPPVDLVASDTAMPARTGVVIIGGGIIGACTALFLAEKGHSVVLCEKGRIGGEQSSRNWGWCRTMGRDEAEIPLAHRKPAAVARHERNAPAAKPVSARPASSICAKPNRRSPSAGGVAGPGAAISGGCAAAARRAIDAVMPGARACFIGALHTPTDGRAEPSQAAPAIAEAARARGATILTDCAVRGIETQGGRVVGRGHRTRPRSRCDAVVLAGGAWSRLFCGNAGIELPQLKVLGSVFRTAPLSGGTGDHRRRFGVRLSQAARRRLFDRPAQRQHRRDHAGLLSAAASISCRTLRQNYGEIRAAPRPALHGGMRAPNAVGRWTRPRRSRRCACSIRCRARRCWPKRAPCCRAAFPAFARYARGGELGRADRRHAGRSAGDR